MFFDELANMTLNPRVPADERRDAQAEIYRHYASGVDRSALDEIREDVFGRFGGDLTAKGAVGLEPYAYQARLPAGHQRRHSSILHINEFGIVDTRDAKSRWFEKRGVSGFQLLKDISTNVDIAGAINFTRIRQVLPFSRTEREEGPLGFRIIREDGEELTKADQVEARAIERFLLNGGDVDDYVERQRLQRPDWPTFTTKLIADTLSGDACPIELTRTNAGKFSGFHNIDFSTVRRCSEYGYEGRDEIAFLQLHDGLPRIAYGYPDLIYEIRNPRSDVYAGGYGFAENEMALRAITGYLSTGTYNQAGLDRNALPRGVGTLIGKFTDDQLASANRQLKQMLSGPANRFGFVLTHAEEGKGFDWTPIDQFNEMFFARLTIFHVSVFCALHGIDPGEIHFDSFNIRTSSLAGKDTAEKLSLSRDKGLVPLLHFYERTGSILVKLRNPRFRLQLVGLHEEDEQKKHDRIKLTRTFDEIRAMDGEEPHPDPIIGGAIAGNPQMMGLYMQTVGQELAELAGVADEDEDDDGDRQPGPRAPKAKARRGATDGGETTAKAAVVVIERNVGRL